MFYRCLTEKVWKLPKRLFHQILVSLHFESTTVHRCRSVFVPCPKNEVVCKCWSLENLSGYKPPKDAVRVSLAQIRRRPLEVNADESLNSTTLRHDTCK